MGRISEKRSDHHVTSTGIRKDLSPRQITYDLPHTGGMLEPLGCEGLAANLAIRFMYDMCLINFHKDLWDCYWGQGKQIDLFTDTAVILN